MRAAPAGAEQPGRGPRPELVAPVHLSPSVLMSQNFRSAFCEAKIAQLSAFDVQVRVACPRTTDTHSYLSRTRLWGDRFGDFERLTPLRDDCCTHHTLLHDNGGEVRSPRPMSWARWHLSSAPGHPRVCACEEGAFNEARTRRAPHKGPAHPLDSRPAPRPIRSQPRRRIRSRPSRHLVEFCPNGGLMMRSEFCSAR